MKTDYTYTMKFDEKNIFKTAANIIRRFRLIRTEEISNKDYLRSISNKKQDQSDIELLSELWQYTHYI